MYRRHLFLALRVFEKSASPERVFEQVDQFLRSSEEEEIRQMLISFLGSYPTDAKAGRRERLEQILSQSDHPDFVHGLNSWANSDLASGKEKRDRLRQWFEDHSIPRVSRRAVEETYRYVFPNLYFRSSWSKDRETGLLSVTIRNISNEEIRFSYDHPFEIVKFDFRDEHDFTFPERGQFLDILERKPGDKNQITLQPKETHQIIGLNPWALFAWPREFPIEARLRVIVEIPPLGEVGSGYGSTSHIRFSNREELEGKRNLLSAELVESP
jgi:hypothetical protein